MKIFKILVLFFSCTNHSVNTITVEPLVDKVQYDNHKREKIVEQIQSLEYQLYKLNWGVDE